MILDHDWTRLQHGCKKIYWTARVRTQSQMPISPQALECPVVVDAGYLGSRLTNICTSTAMVHSEMP